MFGIQIGIGIVIGIVVVGYLIYSLVPKTHFVEGVLIEESWIGNILTIGLGVGLGLVSDYLGIPIWLYIPGLVIIFFVISSFLVKK